MFQKITDFFSEVKVEMKKVTWPTREELVESTKLVIVASIVVTVFIGAVDNILSAIIRLLLGW
ncbi:MAG: preprotein translocase subunit SecE [Candidatus Latescibacteria bacterium]|nr:preprotein translocase subunit SecE [bacterium]MBD3425299.1 preprotein translocase subunit SecE [Candidatus Latescibacterota bacterium]